MTTLLDPIIETLVEETDAGLVVRAPRVGLYRNGPHTGRRRAGGDAVGSLTVLNHTLTLVLSTEACGLVSEACMTGSTTAVEYGQKLFTLVPQETKRTTRGKKAKTATHASKDLPEGTHAVTSPIDGIFYRSSAPGAHPFVEVGTVVSTGQTVGLIEAMKSFNAVTYGGPGLPPRARITKLKADDASETRQGAILFLVTSEHVASAE